MHISQFNFIFCSRPTTGLQQNLVATRCMCRKQSVNVKNEQAGRPRSSRLGHMKSRMIR
ncbi:hypothetical protein HMPREF9349_04105 [Escherichia coli MS 79-10]|nr:hypothetical protein HMPREF9349_04105 [Escherichia coli MS 79-10]